MLFLSALFCALAGPLLSQASLTPRADSCTPATPYTGYAFVYFKNDDERLYLAVSHGNNALMFSEVNGGKPILTSTKGAKGLRDPGVIRTKEGNKFYILNTDLCVGCGQGWGPATRWGSRSLEIWNTTDFITFSEQRHTLVSPKEYGMTWAPEAIYNPAGDNYLVHWASGIYNETSNPGRKNGEYTRIVYATTKDFSNFSAPTVWEDYPPEGRVDAYVYHDAQGDGKYYRFTKGVLNGCSDFIQESSTNLTAKQADWKPVTSCIGKSRGTADLEGPIVFKTNPGDVNGEKYILLGDMIISGGHRGYVPFFSDSLSSGNWTLGNKTTYPFRPRHGAVVPLTSAEMQNLKVAYNVTFF